MTQTEEKSKNFIHPNAYMLWVDGSFRPPDNAACAYILYSHKKKEVTRMARFAHRGSTINQMELMAINRGLDCPGIDYIHIYCDSAYAIGCLSAWPKAWEKNNWISPTGQPIKNKELIQEILGKLRKKKYYRFYKVAAHTGDPFNTVVDRLAAGLTYDMVHDSTIIDKEEFW